MTLLTFSVIRTLEEGGGQSRDTKAISKINAEVSWLLKHQRALLCDCCSILMFISVHF